MDYSLLVIIETNPKWVERQAKLTEIKLDRASKIKS